MKDDIAITGMGVVCALGNSVEQAVTAAIGGQSGIRRCDDQLWGEYGVNLDCRIGGTVTGFDHLEFLPDKAKDYFDIATTFALGAVDQAVRQADLPESPTLRDRTAVIIGSAAPGVTLYHRVMREIFIDGKAADLPGRLLPQLSGNISAAMVAMQYGFRGPNFSIVNACATGGTALSLAADAIRLGRADVVVAGGTDAPIGLPVFGSMLNARAMARETEPDGACRPFDARRRGLVIGEGAGVLVLESMQSALRRGAKILGVFGGSAQTSDAYHVYSPEPTGCSWARTMQLALDDAGVTRDAIDLVSAHAASTPLGDRIESEALKIALGRRAAQVPIAATKSMHGHTFGAAGAIETILSLEARTRGWALPTINLEEADPACDLDYTPNQARRTQARVLLKNSFGFGGTNSSLVLGAAPSS